MLEVKYVISDMFSYGCATAKRSGGDRKAYSLEPSPQARGMQRESVSVSLAMMVLSDNTHLAEHVI